jgi:hypothetical protein
VRTEAQPAGADRAGGVGLGAQPAVDQIAVLRDRFVEAGSRLAHEAALQLTHEDVQLALGDRAHLPSGAGKPIPGASEREKVGARTPAVRRQHRAHAAVAVDVRAGDDALVRLHAIEHRLARRRRQAIDRSA